MDKFMRESTNGTLSNVNFQHNPEDKAQAHLVECFILRTEEMVNAVKVFGIKDAEIGSAYVAYKFDNQEDYDKAVEAGFTGFSIEIILQRELKLNKNNDDIINNNFMTKVKKFVDKFKALLNEFETGEVKLEEGKIADTDIVLRWGEIGEPVLQVAIAEDGTETLEPAAEGEYVLENANILVVDAMGNLLEIKENTEEPEAIPEEDLKKKKKYAKTKLESGEVTVVYDEVGVSVDVEIAGEEKPIEEIVDISGTLELPLDSGEILVVDESGDLVEIKEAEEAPTETPVDAEEIPEEAPVEKDVASKTLGEIIDVSKDGEYMIKVVVSGGAITEATVEAAQDLIKKADFAKVEAENAELKDKIEKLEVKPLFNVFTEVKKNEITKDDYKKLNNLELTKKRLGL